METTDPEKIRKISVLAESLRKNSLAVNMEEALKMAERILYDIKKPEMKNKGMPAKKESNDYDITKEDKTISELMQEGVDDIYNGFDEKKPEEQKLQTIEAEAKPAETAEPVKAPEEKPIVPQPVEEDIPDKEDEKEIDLKEDEAPETTGELEEAAEEVPETENEKEGGEQQTETAPKTGKAPFQKGLTGIFGFGKK